LHLGLPGADGALLGGRVAKAGHVALQSIDPSCSAETPSGERARERGVDLRRPPGVLESLDPLRDFDPERLEPGLHTNSTAPGTPLGASAERFVYETYRTSGFCAESSRQHVEETEPWRPGSTLHVITSADPAGTTCPDREVIGAIRTIVGPFYDLPTARHVEQRLPRGDDTVVCEIGSLAVRPNQRGLGVANELHRMAFLAGFRAGVSGFCFLVEQWMIDFFSEVYGLPVHPLAEAREYMGGPVVPVAMWLPEMLDVIEVERPLVYRWAIEDLAESLQMRLHQPIGHR